MIHTNINQRLKFILGFLSLLFLGVILQREGLDAFQISGASAQTFQVMNEIQEKWSIFIGIGMMISFFMYPIVSTLLDPQVFLDITVQGDGDLMKIWQLSRDIMNTIFAFMLIAGAMATVIMANGDYLKKYAVKFIIGIILVNFSWFFPRVILDVSNVLTANIYQLPNIVGTECRFRESDGSMRSCTFPTDFKFFEAAEAVYANAGRGADQNGYTCVSKEICYKPVELDRNTNTAGGVLAGLMLNHARLGEMNKVMASGASAEGLNTREFIDTVISQIIHMGLQLLLIIYIALIMLGMAIALLVRIPVLWITMAFMPLMFIGFVAGDILPDNMNTMKIFKHFIAAAFLPVMMAIPLAVGFILINALAFSSAPESAATLSGAGGNILPGIKDLWSFMWLLMAITVMWKGFKMAVANDEIFSQATSKITDMGTNFGNLARNLPLNVPFIPGTVNKDGTSNLQSLGQLGNSVGAASSAASQGRLFADNKDENDPNNGSVGSNGINLGSSSTSNIESALTRSGLSTNQKLDAIVAELKNHPHHKPVDLVREVDKISQSALKQSLPPAQKNDLLNKLRNP